VKDYQPPTIAMRNKNFNASLRTATNWRRKKKLGQDGEVDECHYAMKKENIPWYRPSQTLSPSPCGYCTEQTNKT